jgi:hypothetical protein
VLMWKGGWEIVPVKVQRANTLGFVDHIDYMVYKLLNKLHDYSTLSSCLEKSKR